MKVKAEGIEAELGYNGITLHIAHANNGKHVGTLGFGKATLKWSKAHAKKGPKKIKVQQLIDWLEEQ